MIIPGYFIGLSCLFLVTYRTLVAYLSDSNAVTIYINRYGEQHLDIFALIVFWIICIVGMIFLIRILKKEDTAKNIKS
jgi:hypothetical protein